MARSDLHPHRLSRIPVVITTLLVVALTGAALADRISWLFVAAYAAASLVTFLAYGRDKSSARLGQWRTRESSLQLLSLACGWPGAVVAERFFHHKSRKVSFLSVFWMTVILNLTGLGYLLWSHKTVAVDQMFKRIWQLLS